MNQPPIAQRGVFIWGHDAKVAASQHRLNRPEWSLSQRHRRVVLACEEHRKDWTTTPNCHHQRQSWLLAIAALPPTNGSAGRRLKQSSLTVSTKPRCFFVQNRTRTLAAKTLRPARPLRWGAWNHWLAEETAKGGGLTQQRRMKAGKTQKHLPKGGVRKVELPLA